MRNRLHPVPKRVVIVDDSRSIRQWLRIVLEQDPRLRVVGEADSAATARQVIKDTDPDVLTLDIEMPGMSGLAFLEKLMTLRPMPVVMISGATQGNSEATITALSLGAIDCIVKPNSALDAQSVRDITRRVFSAACSTVQRRKRPARRTALATETGVLDAPIILIGASTGGVAALEVVLADLPANGPPVVIVQHMPGAFLVSFSQMLNRFLPQDVAIAREDDPLAPGQIRLAPGLGRNTCVSRRAGVWRCHFEAAPQRQLHCPSVDALFRSAFAWAGDVTAILLTGLGRDGAAAMLQLKEAGARTLSQDEETSVVYGMPRAAWELGAAQQQLPLHEIGAAAGRAGGTGSRPPPRGATG